MIQMVWEFVERAHEEVDRLGEEFTERETNLGAFGVQ